MGFQWLPVADLNDCKRTRVVFENNSLAERYNTAQRAYTRFRKRPVSEFRQRSIETAERYAMEAAMIKYNRDTSSFSGKLLSLYVILFCYLYLLLLHARTALKLAYAVTEVFPGNVSKPIDAQVVDVSGTLIEYVVSLTILFTPAYERSISASAGIARFIHELVKGIVVAAQCVPWTPLTSTVDFFNLLCPAIVDGIFSITAVLSYTANTPLFTSTGELFASSFGPHADPAKGLSITDKRKLLEVLLVDPLKYR